MIKISMKKAALILGLCLSANSFAGLITDTVYQKQKIGMFKSYSYMHDINDDGFTLGSATSGSLTINVFDDRGRRDGWETARFYIKMPGFDLIGATTSAFGGSFDSYNGSLKFNALWELNKFGKLKVTVKSLLGDFYVGNSTLAVNTRDVAVPEPATLGLIGLGLAGLGLSRRYYKA